MNNIVSIMMLAILGLLVVFLYQRTLSGRFGS